MYECSSKAANHLLLHCTVERALLLLAFSQFGVHWISSRSKGGLDGMIAARFGVQFHCHLDCGESVKSNF
jgi:hypothetical protein